MGIMLWLIIYLLCNSEVQAEMTSDCSVTCKIPASNETSCDSSNGNCLYGCKDGYTGSQCQHTCGSNCLECSTVSNESHASVDTDCSRCDFSTYLTSDICTSCGVSCRPSPDNSTHKCDDSGACLHGCTDGVGGEWCNISCVYRCLQCTIDSADRSKDLCDKCEPNFYLSDGDKTCSRCKSDCLADPNGQEPTCKHIDGFCKYGCKGGSRCGRRCQNGCGGLCLNQQCDRTTCCCTNGCLLSGYTGCKCSTRCQTSCIDKLCHQNGTCTIGCKPNFWDYTCKPCSSTCKDGGNSSTSICNSNSGFCNDGCVNDAIWGPTCDKKCPDNCKHGNCNANTGFCNDGCINYVTWGPTCDRKCPDNCMHGKCNAHNGYCNNGCVNYATWGTTCTIKCPDNCLHGECNTNNGLCKNGCVNSATWGITCESKCPDNCMHSECSWDSGLCTAGCVRGWYGTSCRYACNTNCINSTCSQMPGNCTDGCMDGWYSYSCDRACPEDYNSGANDERTAFCTAGCDLGWFGEQCAFGCSSYCNNNPTGDQTGVTEDQLGEQFTLGAVTVAFTAAGILAVLAVFGVLLYRRYYVSKRPIQASNVEIAPPCHNENDNTGGYEALTVERNSPAYEMVQL